MSDQVITDMALETLLSVSKNLKLPLPEKLVQAAYLIQRRHQFDRDPQASYQEMKRLVNEFAQETPSLEGGNGK